MRRLVQIVQLVVYRVHFSAPMRVSFPSLSFKPTFVPTLAALMAVILTGYLGYWQQERAGEKRALQREFDARSRQSPVILDALTRDPATRYRQASAKGEWHAPGQIYVDNQVQHAVVGYHVITPLKLEGTNSYVLVNRGWIARGSSFPLPPVADVAVGRVAVTGQLSLPSSRFLELSHQSVQGSVWQNLTIERYRNVFPLDVLPFVVVVQDALPPLEKVAFRPDARSEKHVEYMLTWYSLAATVIALWVVLNTKFADSDVDTQNRAAGPQGSAGERGNDS